MDVQSGESEKEEVAGEGIGVSEMEELVPEWGWWRDKLAHDSGFINHWADLAHCTICLFNTS